MVSFDRFSGLESAAVALVVVFERARATGQRMRLICIAPASCAARTVINLTIRLRPANECEATGLMLKQKASIGGAGQRAGGQTTAAAAARVHIIVCPLAALIC